jgi:hypothetical protein
LSQNPIHAGSARFQKLDFLRLILITTLFSQTKTEQSLHFFQILREFSFIGILSKAGSSVGLSGKVDSLSCKWIDRHLVAIQIPSIQVSAGTVGHKCAEC